MMRGVCTAMLTDYRNSRKNRQKGTEIPSLSVQARHPATGGRFAGPATPARGAQSTWRPRP